MGKAALTAPLYISIAWSLIISYQFFTQTTVYSIVHFLNSFWPSAGGLLISRVDTVVFIHAFAWIFVLSSVIPSIILGRGRSVLLQFFLCLTVTFIAVSLEDILTIMMGTNPTTQMRTMSVWFQNPLIAGIYLSVPYLFMLYLDIRSRKEGKREKKLEKIGAAYFEEGTPVEQEVSNAAASYEANEGGQVCQRRSKGRINFLHGASAVCFLLAFFTFWFGDIIPSTILPMSYKLVYIVVFTALGATLLVLGLYLTNIQRQMLSYREEGEPQQKLGEYVKPSEVGLTNTMEKYMQEPSETPAEELIEQTENLIEIQIQEQYYDVQLKIKKYDVRHPKDIVDSQC